MTYKQGDKEIETERQVDRDTERQKHRDIETEDREIERQKDRDTESSYIKLQLYFNNSRDTTIAAHLNITPY